MKKKRLIAALLAAVMACGGAFALSGCNDDGNKENGDAHTSHTYDKQVAENKFLKTPADCTHKATFYYSCECGKAGTETFEYGETLPHDYSIKWSSDTTQHWHACTVCGDKKDLENHDFSNGDCKCGAEKSSPTEGLIYTFNAKEQSYSCTGIGTATVTDIVIAYTYEGKPVTAIGFEAFRGCNKLTSITIPYGVTSIGAHAFEECSRLTGVIIPDSVTSISSWAFCECSSLKNISIAEGVTNIESEAFVGCSLLESINIPASVTSIGEYNPFAGCSSLDSITVAESNTKYRSKDNCLIDIENKTLIAGCKNSVIPSDGSVISIGEEAFYGCSGLTNITIPDSVTSISGGAFVYCTGLINITIPDSVTSIGIQAFDNCSGLTSIIIPDSVTSIGEAAFEYCSKLTSITIPDSVTDIGVYAFCGCSSLESIIVAEGNTKYCGKGNCLIDIENKILIVGCNNSVIPSDGSVTSIYNYAFAGYSTLASITIPNSVTNIGEFAFYECSSLTSIIYNGTMEQWKTIAKEDYSWKEETGNYSVTCTDGKLDKDGNVIE